MSGEDWYDEAYRHLRPEFLGLKMVMEQPPGPERFLGVLTRTIGDRSEVVGFAAMVKGHELLAALGLSPSLGCSRAQRRKAADCPAGLKRQP